MKSAEIVVRDAETKKWIGSVWYGVDRGWVAEVYDGTGKSIDSYASASEALDALLGRLSA